MSVEQNLTQSWALNYQKVAAPVANYVPGRAITTGEYNSYDPREDYPFELVFVSGQISRDFSTGKLITGKLGADLTVEQGQAAARSCGLSIISVIKSTAGNLAQVVKIVKMTCMVNAIPEFEQHPQVANGCSDLFVEVFGKEIGSHSRAAFGVGSLPLNVAVEIEAIVQIGRS